MKCTIENYKELIDFEVEGVSYIGKPRSNTAMYVTRKVSNLICNLEGISKCLVFAENGIEVQENILESNCFVFSDSPQLDYARYTTELQKRIISQNSTRKMELSSKGYYVGENVSIGKNTVIEPLCYIGHDVVIGDDCYIMAGSIVKNAFIGNGCILGENCVVGSYGFTMTTDESGRNIRIPTLGKVIIEDNVEIGNHNNICSGSGGDTVIRHNAKLGPIIELGHDVEIGPNCEITAGSVIAGYVSIGENTFVGLGSTIKNRKTIGSHVHVGMGSVVTTSIKDNRSVFGNPAKKIVVPGE